MKLKVGQREGKIVVLVKDDDGKEWPVKNVTSFSFDLDNIGGVYHVQVDALFNSNEAA